MNELLVVTPNGYKTSKLYSVVPANGTGDLTWVRNTTATRVNSSGLIESVGANVPRLDYTGGVTCPCILVEPQRTNLVLRSSEIDNAFWNKQFLNVSGVPAWVNQAVAPDGTTTAEKIIPNTTNAFHRVYANISVTNTLNYSFSFFAKAVGYNFVQIAFNTNFVASFINAPYANFNLSNGTIGNSGNGITSVSIESYGNGWFRCSGTAAAIGTGLGEPNINIANSATDTPFQSWIGNNSDGVYIWGVQFEQGASKSSYIPTVASIQTRNADVATVATPAGITSLIETYEDNTTNVVNPIPVTYQMSEGRIAKVVGL